MTVPHSHLLLRAFCDELARCGVREAVTSPGSRNTPLLLALVRETRIRAHSLIDERCAGFFALGAAKASGTPVAVTCTSGTAAANLLPAVVEAWHARVPLIVLTADRPPELRDIGAGQAIDQVKLFGGAVRWFVEVGVDEATAANLRWIRTLACRAHAIAASGPAGPVHLNFPLREPLTADGLSLADPLPGREGGRPWVEVTPPTPRAPTVARAAERPVVAAGAGSPAELHRRAAEAGVPLLADPLSGARRGPAAVVHYDLLAREPAFTGRHRPDLVLRTGELPTSKPLRTWLAELADVEQVAADPDRQWHDPAAVVARRVTELALPPPGDGAWLGRWLAADAAVAAALAPGLGDQLSEPAVAARLPTWLPREAILYVASSMPVRDLETFMPRVAEPPLILSNRGANGIDGTVSSAFGAAAATGRPTVLLIGDVALAHDIGGLLAARRPGIPLTIVLLNNDGGGIFHFLPVAGQAEIFAEHVLTPHGLDFAHAAALYGCQYERSADVAALERAVSRSVASGGATIIEVRTDRDENRALHRRLADAAGSAMRN